MASHPAPLKLLALGLHSYFVWYWGKQLLGDPSEARPERGVGLLGSAGAQAKYHARGQKIIEAFRNERRQKLQKVRGSAQMGQVAGKFADLGPIGSRVGVLRDLVRRYSGADAAAMRNPQHVAQVGALTEAVREVVAQRCKPANEEKGDGGWCAPEKDWKAEVKALYNWYRANVRYTRDPTFVDTFSAPDRTLGTKAGDCLPAGTLLLTKDRGYQPIELIREGDEVQGDGVWTKVTRWWDKGTLPTLTFKLNNGSVLTCTAEHKLFRVPKHCQSAGPREEAEEVLASEVRPGDDLMLAATQPAGVRSLDPELAWLIGTFVADGWIDGDRVSIAGRDRTEDRVYGKKDKGPQKDRIAAFYEARGIITHRTEKDIRFRNAELHELLSRCGKGAINKQLPFIDVDAPTARAVLDGLMADASTSKYGTVVFSTISPTLALQIRALHRILGVRTNIRRVAKHGGFGSNPIYRVSVVRNGTVNGKRAVMMHARVEEIAQGDERQVYDIETDTHRFYLPETDLIVHNCDDGAVVLGTLLTLIGCNIRFRVIQTKDAQTWSHIYLMVDVDGGGKQWLPLDVTMPHGFPWQAPGAAECARSGKPSGIVTRVRDFPL